MGLICFGSNKIKELPPYLLQGLSSIASILFQNNQIRKISDGFFKDKKKAAIIVFSNNQLNQFPKTLVSNLTKVINLDLWKNNISHKEKVKIFHENPKLKEFLNFSKESGFPNGIDYTINGIE